MFIKVTQAWKQGAGMGVRVSGTWKVLAGSWVKVQGSWKPFDVTIPAIKLTGTAQGDGSNNYHYETFSQAAVTVASGDKLAFECYLPAGTTGAGIEARYTKSGSAVQTLRDLGTINDQNGLSIHPNTALGVSGKWVYRVFDLTPVAGAAIDTWAVALEDDSAGVKTAYFRNIRILNSAGAEKLAVFKDTMGVPALSTFMTLTAHYSAISKSVVPSPP